jgi:hypothetical protein
MPFAFSLLVRFFFVGNRLLAVFVLSVLRNREKRWKERNAAGKMEGRGWIGGRRKLGAERC